MADIRLFKIVYDDATRASVAPPYMALENADGPRDWFEFWPIFEYLRATPLDEDAWYGFVSPRFESKAKIGHEGVRRLIEADPAAEVALFSHSWAELAFYRNPWEQAEVWHPGVTALSEAFFGAAGVDFDIQSAITDFETSVFSNYIVARPRFWRAWTALAARYFAFVEAEGPDGPHARHTWHRGVQSYAMKTFVQERFASIVLIEGGFRVVRPDYPRVAPDLFRFPNTAAMRADLMACEAAKRAFRASGDPRDLDQYAMRRAAIDRSLTFARARARIGGAVRRLFQRG